MVLHFILPSGRLLSQRSIRYHPQPVRESLYKIQDMAVQRIRIGAYGAAAKS